MVSYLLLLLILSTVGQMVCMQLDFWLHLPICHSCLLDFSLRVLSHQKQIQSPILELLTTFILEEHHLVDLLRQQLFTG